MSRPRLYEMGVLKYYVENNIYIYIYIYDNDNDNGNENNFIAM